MKLTLHNVGPVTITVTVTEAQGTLEQTSSQDFTVDGEGVAWRSSTAANSLTRASPLATASGLFLVVRPACGSRQEVRRARSMPSPLLARHGEW